MREFLKHHMVSFILETMILQTYVLRKRFLQHNFESWKQTDDFLSRTMNLTEKENIHHGSSCIETQLAHK